MSDSEGKAMHDFVSRSVSCESVVTIEDGTQVTMTASRTRNSMGFKEIALRLGNIQIRFIGEDYEINAAKAAKLLNEIVANKCMLPEVKS